MKIQLSELNASIQNIPLPDYMKYLPVSKEGFPVPYFVAKHPQTGVWDFRVVYPETRIKCLKDRLCWICGQTVGIKKAFVVGPMCVITKTSAEPPCHYSCARYAAIACPFLAAPRMKRNEKDLPEGHTEPAGVAIMRNPGVAAVLITRSFELFKDGRGDFLIRMGEPEAIEWFAQRRTATRAEVQASIDSGVHLLFDEAKLGGAEETAELQQYIKNAERWLPNA